MSWFKDAVKKVGNFAGDIAKATVAVTALTVNSVLGKETKFDPRTGAGKYIGGGAIIGAQSVNIAAKTWADGVTGGYATKLANTVRKDENKESQGNYSEQASLFAGDTGVLGKFESVSKKGAAIATQVFAKKSGVELSSSSGGAMDQPSTFGGASKETLSSVTQQASQIGSSFNALAEGPGLKLEYIIVALVLLAIAVGYKDKRKK